MGGLSIWHWLALAVVAMIFLGKGKFSEFMGDAGKGLKNFKKGLSEEEEPARPAPQLQVQTPLEPNKDPALQPMKDDRPHV